MRQGLAAGRVVRAMDAIEEGSASWLARFHAGDREVLAACYRDHFATVEAAVRRYVGGADQETVVHDVFYSLLSSRRTRQGFHGGSLGAWLTTVARNRAIDYLRAHARLGSVDPRTAEALPSEGPDPAQQAEARLLIERFRRELLPDRWVAVFEARFVRQLSQREAAAALGCSRTTLAYQEHRVRRLLRRFLLQGEADR
jgi:RNA polymerase sigma-70 factor (ECF subfamily)